VPCNGGRVTIALEVVSDSRATGELVEQLPPQWSVLHARPIDCLDAKRPAKTITPLRFNELTSADGGICIGGQVRKNLGRRYWPGVAGYWGACCGAGCECLSAGCVQCPPITAPPIIAVAIPLIVLSLQFLSPTMPGLHDNPPSPHLPGHRPHTH